MLKNKLKNWRKKMPRKYKNVCNECGIEANRLTCLKKRGKEPAIPKFAISTYHKGKCDFCGKITDITEVRDFFYPDFRLLKVAQKKAKEV